MRLRLKDKIHETGNIWSFRFETEDNLKWLAGQSIRVELPRKTWGYNERRFTITSLPVDGYLQITTRIGDSEFKRDLEKLNIGNEIDAYNIEGKIEWGDIKEAKIFIAGGTAINLFYIALRQANIDNLPINVTLLYSSRDKPALFSDFFEAQSSANKIKLITSDKRFEIDRIIEEIRKHSSYDLHIAGPDSMVFDTKKSLQKAGIDSKKLDSKFLI